MSAHGQNCHRRNLNSPHTYLNECVNVPVVGNMAFSCNKEKRKQLEEIVFALFLLFKRQSRKSGTFLWRGVLFKREIAKSSINYLQVMLKFERLIAFGAFKFPQEG
jgi:hypothetical protein